MMKRKNVCNQGDLEGVSWPHHTLSGSLSMPNPFLQPECTDGADREGQTATMCRVKKAAAVGDIVTVI